METTKPDKIKAKVSKGELIIPPNIVEFLGVAHFEKLRQKAKEGLAEMESNGRIGGDPEEDELPFSDEELTAEDMEEDGAQGFAEGGLAWNSPEMTGLTNTGVETITYVSPDGTKLPILFMNGQPIQQIPQGFVPEGQAKQAQAPFKSTRPNLPSLNPGEGDTQNLNTMQAKPISEWGVEDFERYSNSQGVMEVVSKLPALLGPGGMIMGGLMNKAYQMQGQQALEEIDNRLAMTDLDEQSRTRLEAVKANLGQNNQEEAGGGLFGGNGLLGGLTGGGGLLEKLFSGGVRTTSEAPASSSPSRSSTPRSASAGNVFNSGSSSSSAPTSSPRPQAKPDTAKPSVSRTSSGNTVSTNPSGTKTTSSPGGSYTTKSAGETNPGGYDKEKGSWSTGKAFAEGGLVKRRNKK